MKKFLKQMKTEINSLVENTDEELTAKIEKIKKRSKKEPLENFMKEWFALVQEISFRKIGLKHFESQLLAGMYLHKGNIVEMKTGEGKTLASTLAISLNAITGKGVHVVTVNDYLAERDQKWMGKIYSGLGLSSGLVKSTSSITEKKKSYAKDITYITNSELVFDFLRDSSSYYLDEIVQRPFNYCVIDEIDSILIDEARTPLIISESDAESDMKKLSLSKSLAEMLEKEKDFEIDEKRKEINLTENGYEKAKETLGKNTLYDPDDPWILEILNALKAKHLFKMNKDYIVLNEKILIVDEFTGRTMEDRRWNSGIHEAIEMKENVDVKDGTKTKTSITYQNFFTLYPKLAGMTGTGKTTEKEFNDIYNLKVVVIPTSKPMIRNDLSDLVYRTEVAKFNAVVSKAKECYEKGQPILIGTASVEKSELLSDLLNSTEIRLPHQVLNAKPENVFRESEIIAQAGESNAITIATNMAGRGTDIILGGNPMFKVKQEISDLVLQNDPIPSELPELETFVQNIILEYSKEKKLDRLENDIQTLPYSLETILPSLQDLYNYLYSKMIKRWEIENKKVKEVGGLFVLGTERHETRRIDNQLRGRSGRQGDPGSSQFFVCLEDELLQIFGGENIKGWMDYLMQDENIPLESNFLTKSIEKAQQKVEFYNYEIRKNVFEYDDLLNEQRKKIFESRKEILSKNIGNDIILRYGEVLFDEMMNEYIQKNASANQVDLFGRKQNTVDFSFCSDLEKWFDSYAIFVEDKIEKNNFYKEIWITNDLRSSESNLYYENWTENTKGPLPKVPSVSFTQGMQVLSKGTFSNITTKFVSTIDSYWTEHLERMNFIRETISWRSYGQQNPLTEYNVEASNSFNRMFQEIRSYMLYYSLIN